MTKEYLEHFSVYEAEKRIKTHLNDLYVHRPREPRLKSTTPTEEELSKFLAEKEEYQKLLKEYNVNNDFYKSESSRLYAILEDKVREDSGLNDIPEQYRDKVFRYAWSERHFSGYYEVYNRLCDLTDIFN